MAKHRKKRNKPRKSEVRIQYEKQERRIKRALRELGKQGWRIAFNLPEKPKRITKKAVEKLAQVTRSFLRSKGTYEEPKTESYEQSSYFNDTGTFTDTWADTIIQNLIDILDEYVGSSGLRWFFDRFIGLLDSAIMHYGKISVAHAIANTPDDKIELFVYCVHHYPSEVAMIVYVGLLLKNFPNMSLDESFNEMAKNELQKAADQSTNDEDWVTDTGDFDLWEDI